LQKGDRLLCIACGYGDELPFFRMAYELKQATGLDANPKAAANFEQRPGLRLVHGDASDIARGRHLFRHGEFDKVIAVDGIYHCDKESFFEDCAGVLPEGGMVAVSDVVLQPGAPTWMRLALRAMGIRAANQWTKVEYLERLQGMGLTNTKFESLEPFVLATWFPASMRRHLDYCLISARLDKTRKRPKAAIVGSGLSGLVAAHLLSRTHDVCVFEARSVPGFAGSEAKLPNGVSIDVPLRMIEPHYWKTVVALCDELNVPLVDTNFTMSIYGKGGMSIRTDDSLASTVLGNFSHYLRIFISAVRLYFTSPQPGETLLSFVSRAGLADTEFYSVYARRHLSWVLSCTYDMVDAYPAELVVSFFRAIQSNYFRKGSPTRRIKPSVKALEDVLLAGRSIKVGHCVKPFGQDKVIDGQAFDIVVIATEANAVNKILPREWTGFFCDFTYHPSSVYVHRDQSLMPENMDEWRSVNVCNDSEGKACQLSVWLNAFYGSKDLGVDVFETVNPVTVPDQRLIVKEVHLQRVVHNVNSARLQAAISEAQGREGFYFAGAYAVHGMGLLEQAVHSAHRAVAAVHRDMAQQGATA